jgi:multidrug efflux pump subunit AcrB
MLKWHIQKRPEEAYIAVYTMLLGVWIFLPTVSMGSAGYVHNLETASELTWGLMFLFTGSAHLVAVLLNGLRWWTPISRTFTSLLMVVLYGSWTWGFALAFPSSTAVFMYGALMGVSLMCLKAAVFDTAKRVGTAHARIYR